MEKELSNLIALANGLEDKDLRLKIVNGLLNLREANNNLLKTLNDIRERIDKEFT